MDGDVGGAGVGIDVASGESPRGRVGSGSEVDGDAAGDLAGSEVDGSVSDGGFGAPIPSYDSIDVDGS